MVHHYWDKGFVSLVCTLQRLSSIWQHWWSWACMLSVWQWELDLQTQTSSAKGTMQQNCPPAAFFFHLLTPVGGGVIKTFPATSFNSSSFSSLESLVDLLEPVSMLRGSDSSSSEIVTWDFFATQWPMTEIQARDVSWSLKSHNPNCIWGSVF